MTARTSGSDGTAVSQERRAVEEEEAEAEEEEFTSSAVAAGIHGICFNRAKIFLAMVEKGSSATLLVEGKKGRKCSRALIGSPSAMSAK